MIILAAKKFIWIQKFRELVPGLDRFKIYLFDFIKNLKYIHDFKNDNDTFAESWNSLLQHLEATIEDGENPVG